VTSRGPVTPPTDGIFACFQPAFYDSTSFAAPGFETGPITTSALGTLHRSKPLSTIANLHREDVDEAETEIAVLGNENVFLCQSIDVPDQQILAKIEDFEHRNQNLQLLLGSTRDIPCIGFLGEIVIENMSDMSMVIQCAGISKPGSHLAEAPILISFFEMFTQNSDLSFKDGVEMFVSVLELLEDRNVLIGGIEMILPDEYDDGVVRHLISWLERYPKAKLALNVPASHKVFAMGMATFATYVCNLYEAAQNRILIGSCVRFNSEMIRHGGLGYGSMHSQLISRLQKKGLSEENISKMVFHNALELFSWYFPPAKAAAPKLPKWLCDGPCGKMYSAKKDPFTRLNFKYCSMICLNAHRDSSEPKVQTVKTDNSKRGGNGSGGWGISVHS